MRPWRRRSSKMKRRKRRRYKPRSMPTTDPPGGTEPVMQELQKRPPHRRPFLTTARAFAAAVRSDFAIVEQQHICAAGREFRHIGSCCLALGAAESRLNGCQVVKVQGGDQMEAGRPCGRRYRTFAHFILSQAGYFLRNGNMRFKIVFVESG